MSKPKVARWFVIAGVGAIMLAAVAASPGARVWRALPPNGFGGQGPAGSSYDNIEGVATTNGVETPVRATSSYYPMPVDQTMVNQSNRDRIAQLTEALA